MKGLLVFDNLNDIIYLNSCPKFIKHVTKLAATQGLISSEHATLHGKGNKCVDPNILVQLFSPLVTSQRFMREQFGNPYNSLQCQDGTTIIFQEYMGFLFLKIGTEDISYLKRTIGVTITLVANICGPDVSLLKKSTYHSSLLDNLLDSWSALYATDESFMIEGVQQLNVSPQFNSTVVKSLQHTVSKVQNQLGSNVHALLFLGSKVLSWYSTKHARNLTPQDLLFLILLCHKSSHSHKKKEEDSSKPEGTKFSDSSSSFGSSKEFSEFEDEWDVVGDDEGQIPIAADLVKYFVLLKNERDFVPQLVHIGIVQEGLYLVLISEPSTSPLISLSSSGFRQAISFHSKPRELSSDKLLFSELSSVTGKLLDLLKKQRNVPLRLELSSRWEVFRGGYSSFLKSKEGEETRLVTSPLIAIYREIFRSYFNQSLISRDSSVTEPLDLVWSQIKNDTGDFWGFLRMKANPNLIRGASMNKYLEEFPGLVHFIYVDRTKHAVIIPTMDFSRDDTVKLTKTKIWGMVKFAREHMGQGHFSLMWKDAAFNYAYFLWFEDNSGTPIRPKQPAMPWEGYPLPGIMCGDFYKRVLGECFPDGGNKLRCFELFCIHLGLATSSCVLEHSKRLATNIFDEHSAGNPATDIL